MAAPNLSILQQSAPGVAVLQLPVAGRGIGLAESRREREITGFRWRVEAKPEILSRPRPRPQTQKVSPMRCVNTDHCIERPGEVCCLLPEEPKWKLRGNSLGKAFHDEDRILSDMAMATGANPCLGCRNLKRQRSRSQLPLRFCPATSYYRGSAGQQRQDAA